MSYICEFCCLRPENCGCSIDLTEPRLESELVATDNIMAVENNVIQKPDNFFSLLIKIEEDERKYDTPPSTPAPTHVIKLPPPPKMERQTNRPLDLCVSDQHLKELNLELFPDEDLSDIDSQYCEKCYGFICDCDQSKLLEENEGVSPDQFSREYYETTRDCGNYDYYQFCRDFIKDDYDKLIKCPTCEKMIDPNEQNGICYDCFVDEQRLYPDDISMELRYNSDIDRDSF